MGRLTNAFTLRRILDYHRIRCRITKKPTTSLFLTTTSGYPELLIATFLSEPDGYGRGRSVVYVKNSKARCVDRWWLQLVIYPTHEACA